MSNAHQLADRHPWHPSALVKNDVADQDGTLHLEVVKDLRYELSPDVKVANLATALIYNVLGSFKELCHECGDNPAEVRRVLRTRQVLMESRFNQARLRRKGS